MHKVLISTLCLAYICGSASWPMDALADSPQVDRLDPYNQEKPKLLLYYSPTCPYSQRVLNYLSAIHKTIPMKNIYASPAVKEELKKRGGKLQVPCLMIDEQPLYETSHIIQWLADNKDLY